MSTLILTITGLHCASCKLLIEDVGKDVPGVISCMVDPTTGQTVIEHNDPFKTDEFKKEIEALGKYHVTLTP